MLGAWDRSIALLREPANEVAFVLRRWVRWSRGTADLADEPKHDLFADLPTAAADAAETRARDLRHRYDLADLAARSTRVVYRKNLALLDRLEALAAGIAMPSPGPGGVRTAIDVGSGDFHYATALQRWLARAGAAGGIPVAVRLQGIELDGHGIYRDGHARADHARAHAALAGAGVSYTVADFGRRTWEPVDVVSLFHPFLSAWPLLTWGLPLSQLRPRRLLARVVASIRCGGLLVVANQTAAEFERLVALLAGHPLARVATVPFAEPLSPDGDRTTERVGSLWRRL